jgi:hypothetical protein
MGKVVFVGEGLSLDVGVKKGGRVNVEC